MWFLAHRPLFELARATDPGSSYYGAELPWGLPFLSSTGQASGSPEGADKYGMICSAPTDLGRGWWMCGLAGSGL
ncbi:hypothetical protein H7I02_08475 [Mycolicibacterium brumae]|nr:hypothetical protein [Mycolicibacterium brumae]